MRSISEELQKDLSSAAQQAGCELLHARLAGGVLRLVLDRPEGIRLVDCESVSRRVSALLDSLDFDPGRYVLEVSSPGLDREFYSPRDYERFVGRSIRVRFRDPGSDRPRTVVGRLDAFSRTGGGTVTVTASEGDEELSIGLEHIETARLEVEL